MSAGVAAARDVAGCRSDTVFDFHPRLSASVQNVLDAKPPILPSGGSAIDMCNDNLYGPIVQPALTKPFR
jgi:hypothetical protein